MYESKCWFMQHAPTYNMVSLEKSSTKVTDLLLFFSGKVSAVPWLCLKDLHTKNLTQQKGIVLKTYEILGFLP